MSKKEASARIKINNMLTSAGWVLEDTATKKANVMLEVRVKTNVVGVSLVPTQNFQDEIYSDKKDTHNGHSYTQNDNSLGNDFEHTADGYIDYLLLDNKGFGLCVLEAKRESIHPLSAKDQAKSYALRNSIPFIILSNGNTHYFWDIKHGNPEQIIEFPNQESLQNRLNYRPNKDELINVKVSEFYLAESKYPSIGKMKQSDQTILLNDSKLKKLRYYQVEAIQSIQQSVSKGKTRFLLEMATGTGKTTTTAGICKLFLSTGNAKRILFLVDRIELETQAQKELNNMIGKDYPVGRYKDGRSGEWKMNKVVVSTIQSLMAGDRYKTDFCPTDFEMVISDEAHRSLGGDSRKVFEYFVGFKLGLTATPKNYLKGIDQQDAKIDSLEIRKLRDTYKTFGCDDGVPTYQYNLQKGANDGFLIMPKVFDARTDVSTRLLEADGYNIENENGDEENYKMKDFEKKFFNEETNNAFCKTILDNAKRDPITGEIGKTVIFCVSQNHCAKITQILNQLVGNKCYQSDFAVQISSYVLGANDLTTQFANNTLNGRSKFDATKEDYKTTKTRIVCTVGMMSTGYDCPDLLNIVMMKPIFSPSDFVQIKGRGTRRFVFQNLNETESKEDFYLFDFFGNCEYFENEFDYNAKLKVNIGSSSSKATDKTTIKQGKYIDFDTNDSLESIDQYTVDANGMKIDRELYRPAKVFEDIAKSQEVQKIYQEQGLEATVDYFKNEVFDKPNEYLNPDKLRKSYNFKDRWLPLGEMLQKALGLIPFFKTKETRMNELYNSFIISQKIDLGDSVRNKLMRDTFEMVLSDRDFELMVEDNQYIKLSEFGFDRTQLRMLGINQLEQMVSYCNEYLQKEKQEFRKS